MRRVESLVCNLLLRDSGRRFGATSARCLETMFADLWAKLRTVSKGGRDNKRCRWKLLDYSDFLEHYTEKLKHVCKQQTRNHHISVGAGGAGEVLRGCDVNAVECCKMPTRSNLGSPRAALLSWKPDAWQNWRRCSAEPRATG